MRARSLCVLAIASLWIAPAGSAQETEVELLRALLCETRELRAAVQQAQIVTPLIEANSSERSTIRTRISDLEAKESELGQLVQQSMAQQGQIRQQLLELSRSGASESSDEAAKRRDIKAYLESEVKRLDQQVQNHQSEQNRVASERLREQGRLDQLEAELDQIKRQMRNLAAASDALCAGTESAQP